MANDSSADWALILEDDVSLVVPEVDRQGMGLEVGIYLLLYI